MSALKQYREDRDLTLKAVGDRLGVDKSTILRWERYGVPADRILEVSKRLGIPREKLGPRLFKGYSPTEVLA
jgi:transcriptional regulator with XRE-family HTH domain